MNPIRSIMDEKKINKALKKDEMLGKCPYYEYYVHNIAKCIYTKWMRDVRDVQREYIRLSILFYILFTVLIIAITF